MIKSHFRGPAHLSGPRLHRVIKSGGGRLPDNLHLNQNVSPFKDIPDDSTTLISTLASKYKLPKIDVRAEEALPYIGTVSSNLYVEAYAADFPPRVIGLYLHGGGYCHLPVHEKSTTSRIPRRLMKVRVTRCSAPYMS
jgi:hypothetical protein